jgi:hypothetical protein
VKLFGFLQILFERQGPEKWMLLFYIGDIIESHMEGKLLYCSPGPVKTYAKYKHCLSLPLSPLTKAHCCAVFIEVETMCKQRQAPKATHSAESFHPRIANECSFLT